MGADKTTDARKNNITLRNENLDKCDTVNNDVAKFHVQSRLISLTMIEYCFTCSAQFVCHAYY